jgi:hypothetical protein
MERAEHIMQKKCYIPVLAVITALSMTAIAPPKPAAAAQSTVDITTNWTRYNLFESEIYTVQAAAGTFRVTLSDIPANGFVHVLLEDSQTSEILLNKTLRQDDNTAEVTLTKGGTYHLLVAPNHVGKVTIQGEDLSVSPEVPAVQLPAMKPFETQNEKFVVQPQLMNPAITESVAVTLNQDVLNQQALQQDGTVAPVTIDPATMADGLYLLTVVGTAKTSGNMGINARTFVVDRQPTFSDVDNHWARRFVEVLSHLKIINGTGDGKFTPDRAVTRAEFAKMVVLTLGLNPGPERPAPFTDIPEDWSKPFIYAMEYNGLMNGVEMNGKRYFQPDRPITRAEAAAIIGRALGIANADISGEPAPFPDFGQVPVWARPSVVLLAKQGWLNGYPDGKFHPEGNLERDETAKLIAKFLGM